MTETRTLCTQAATLYAQATQLSAMPGFQAGLEAGIAQA